MRRHKIRQVATAHTFCLGRVWSSCQSFLLTEASQIQILSLQVTIAAISSTLMQGIRVRSSTQRRTAARILLDISGFKLGQSAYVWQIPGLMSSKLVRWATLILLREQRLIPNQNRSCNMPWPYSLAANVPQRHILVSQRGLDSENVGLLPEFSSSL